MPDPRTLNADLHCHSTVSDGTLSPRAVAERAHAGGVRLWSLTDHDEVGGQAEARAAAEALGMRYVPGVEVSVTWAGQTVHIVGLRIDPFCPELIDGLADTRSGRARRARDIGDALAKIGIEGAYQGALKHVGNPDLISRTHFARWLVDEGYCATISDVFSQYLSEGRPGYVGHRWANLSEAIGWIRAAGGIAVMAHPGRYNYTDTQHDALFDEFTALGGGAVEVVTGSHTPDQYRRYADVARHYGLLASRGSDFHGPGEGRVELGALPPLPATVTPVWHDW
ncbi:3',5'-nucleoside bisphosphate phosphatase [Cupriavidus sp. WKF15]|uniref:3',5'-nucleoside bisphosphate phosphatase n=1 Tax=Cupriavidus sp. WKF15 TaxID=3032282 RepID=UPI0023E0F792|nr:3',5'-nucleoside bisphosphate phosphatase [Cupriavidus sp. WKF15]WER44759.1 3',5'-nucleoside bisphosphate phosphatase [Cupriavidus sp. WKF15]